MVDTRIMCNNHLLGEHVELHMMVGSILKNKKLDGYIKNNLIQPMSIIKRHNDLVSEMLLRKFNHKSVLPNFNLDNYTDSIKYAQIDEETSLNDLLSRCEKCNKRYLQCVTAQKN